MTWKDKARSVSASFIHLPQSVLGLGLPRQVSHGIYS